MPSMIPRQEEGVLASHEHRHSRSPTNCATAKPLSTLVSSYLACLAMLFVLGANGAGQPPSGFAAIRSQKFGRR
jgi:hypothetical protein